MATFQRTAQVGKIESYELDDSAWAASEVILSLTVLNPDNKVTIGATTFSGGLMSVTVTGVTAGNAVLHFEYTTATRSRCSAVTVRVVDGCEV
tara:strand:- start:83 stop:361 length:279 start_codon:yes stop_codon:yes gene_type:complete